MSWHNSFIAALAEEDERRMVELLDSLPPFENIEQMQSALELISEATKKFEIKKSELGRQMHEIENEKKFITSTRHNSTTLLDIHS